MIANAAYLISLPGWILLYLCGLSGIRDQPVGIIAANAIAWMIWILLLTIAWRVRTMLVEPREPQERTLPDTGRRAFMTNAAFGAASIGAIATPGYATLVEPWSIKVRKYSIPIKDLDPAFDGLKLVQLADTHLGPRIPASFVKQAVDLVLAQRPDLVLLTGDHVHHGVDEIDRAAELCKPLVEHASIGVVGVLGNHDWWVDGHRMSSTLRDQGVRMIDNDRVWLDAKTRSIQSHNPGMGSLALVGIGDLTDGVVDIDRAFRGVDVRSSCVVLAHNPDTAELGALIEPGSPRVDLMCSGHTHGGQIKIPFIGTPIVPSRFGSKYAGGLVEGPAFRVHISRGVGMSLLPVRFGVPPEISVLTLTRA